MHWTHGRKKGVKFVEIPALESFNTKYPYLEQKKIVFTKMPRWISFFFVAEWSYVEVFIIPFAEAFCNFQHKRGNKRFLCFGHFQNATEVLNFDLGLVLLLRCYTYTDPD